MPEMYPGIFGIVTTLFGARAAYWRRYRPQTHEKRAAFLYHKSTLKPALIIGITG